MELKMEINLTLPRQRITGETIFHEVSLPSTATRYSVGHDFFAPKPVVFPPNSTTKVHTGVKLRMPKHLWMELHIRSSLAVLGLSVKGGVIDPDYCGEIGVVVRNDSSKPVDIEAGQRFCQGVLHPAIRADIIRADTVAPSSERGESGFGSTGK